MVIALVDVNNFYASCEALFEPSLTGKPVVVLSNNDGCVVAPPRKPKPWGSGWVTPGSSCAPTRKGGG